MSKAFDLIASRVLKIEGLYSNDPDDSGGETNWGVTVALARAHGYLGPMKDMTRVDAEAIYKSAFWSPMNLDLIFEISPAIAEELFESGVNVGVAVVGRFLQRSLNVFNRQGKLYADIKVDGNIGRVTVAALTEYLLARGKEGEVVMLRALNALQGAHYILLAEARVKDERFVYGWVLNRVTI